MSLGEYVLTAREGEAHLIPKYGLEMDSRYFDLESLISMYGEREVEEFHKGKGLVLKDLPRTR